MMSWMDAELNRNRLCRSWFLLASLSVLLWVVPHHVSNAQDPEGTLETPIFYIDSPSVDAIQERDIELGGWVWGGEEDPIDKVVLETDGWAFELEYRQERGDVAVHLNEPSAALSGFHGRVELPTYMSGDRTLFITAYRASGARHELRSLKYRPVQLSALWRRWLDRYPAWREDPFWFMVGSSGVSTRGDLGFSHVYAAYRSDTFRLGLRVPVLYMRSTRGADEDFQFDPDIGRVELDTGFLLVDDWLQGLVDLAIREDLPVLFTLNGGVWGDANGGVPDYDLTDYLELDPMNCQWDQNDRVYEDDLIAGLPGSLKSPELSRVLTLNAYNSQVRRYKRRNLQAAGSFLAEFARDYPHLFAGINLDADVYLSPFVKGSWHDFNPDTLRQFRDWLSGTGLYAEGALLAAYREMTLSLEDVRRISQQDFADWEAVVPTREMPRQYLPGASEPWMLLWERFRRHLVDLHYDDLSQWLSDVGIDASKIYSSQGFMAPRKFALPFAESLDSTIKNYDSAGMTVEGAHPSRGHIGAILYGESSINNIATESGRSLFRTFYDFDPDWGAVEHNTADFRDPPGRLPDYAMAYRSLRELFNFHARVLSPMAWNGSNGELAGAPGFHAHTAYRNTPLESATMDFLEEYAYLPRRALYWTFGMSEHEDADGWTTPSEATILWPEKGALRWRHPEGVVVLESPPDVAVDPKRHGVLVFGARGTKNLRSIAVEFADSSGVDAVWHVASSAKAPSELERDTAGWVIPLDWGESHHPTRLRLIIEAGAVGEFVIDHIAILPTRFVSENPAVAAQ